MRRREGVALLLIPLLACSDGPPTGAPPEAPARRPDVVVVTLDTVRADRIGAYGHATARTETIDALAASGLRFERAYSPLPLTIPAHATMFTGLLPFRHGIRSNGDNVLAEEFTTLAEHLRANGYVTGASVAAFVTTRQWGFAQGFDAYFDTLPEGGATDGNYWHQERDGADVVEDALAWLGGVPAERPVFLWVHLYDAHFPYRTHADTPPDLADRPYDAEIAYLDDLVARLGDGLRGRDVLWALVGDHGESLGQHGESTHGLYAYDATAHVPFILSGPGIDAGVHPDPVSTADLTPTLLHALGLPVPEGLDGVPQPGARSIPYLESYQLADRFRLAPHRAIVSGNLKLVATPRPELYDVAADPQERTNLAEQRPDDVARLRALLDGLGAEPPGAASVALDADTVSQLAALGYVASEGTGGVDPHALPDPKDYAQWLAAVDRLARKSKAGPEATLAEIDKLLAQKSDAFDLRMRKTTLLGRLGRRAEVRAFVDETSRVFPENSRVWSTLAGMATAEGQHEQALEYARRALELKPADPAAQEALVAGLFRLQRTDEALEAGLRFMRESARNAPIASLLGTHFLATGDVLRAEEYLRIAVAAPRPPQGARPRLALLAIAAEARQDAYKLLTDEVAEHPGNLLARRMLNRLYAEDQLWLEQREHAEFLVRLSPKDPYTHMALAQCLFNLHDFRAARRVIDAAIQLDPANPDVLLLHANLLAKEGKRDEGYAVFQEANRLNEERVARPRDADPTWQEEFGRALRASPARSTGSDAPGMPSGAAGGPGPIP